MLQLLHHGEEVGQHETHPAGLCKTVLDDLGWHGCLGICGMGEGGISGQREGRQWVSRVWDQVLALILDSIPVPRQFRVAYICAISLHISLLFAVAASLHSQSRF